MIKVNRLCAGYGKSEVLHQVSLQANSGEITTIIGCNGCGKSTLLKSIAGILPISSGSILVNGNSIASLTPQERAKQTAYLSQGKNTPDITAGRMVLHGRFPYLSYPRRYGKNDYQAAENAMRQMGILDLADRPLSELSGGTRQKVYIAMALAQHTPVVLMDEPTSYLDMGQQLRLLQNLKELTHDGKTVVLVLHDLLFALKISHSICVMDSGSIRMQDAPEKILESGVLTRVYDVEVKSLYTKKGEQYYYDL